MKKIKTLPESLGSNVISSSSSDENESKFIESRESVFGVKNKKIERPEEENLHFKKIFKRKRIRSPSIENNLNSGRKTIPDSGESQKGNLPIKSKGLLKKDILKVFDLDRNKVEIRKSISKPDQKKIRPTSKSNSFTLPSQIDIDLKGSKKKEESSSSSESIEKKPYKKRGSLIGLKK